MRKRFRRKIFQIMTIGTLGLLMNEFVFAWGRLGTLVFAAANVVGLVALGFSYWGKKQDT